MAKTKEKIYSGNDILPWRFRKDEDPVLIKWINIQGVPTDAIRYCVEQEIRRNGLRNLAQFIPAVRAPLSDTENADSPAAAQRGALSTLLTEDPLPNKSVTSSPVLNVAHNTMEEEEEGETGVSRSETVETPTPVKKHITIPGITGAGIPRKDIDTDGW